MTPPVATRVYSYKASCARPGTLTLSPKRQSARMSKITNDGLNRSGTGGVKGLNLLRQRVLKSIHSSDCSVISAVNSAVTAAYHYHLTNCLCKLNHTA